MIEIKIRNQNNEKDYYTIVTNFKDGIGIYHESGEGIILNMENLFEELDKWFKKAM